MFAFSILKRLKVDTVSEFTVNTVNSIKPDVLVKGGDYKVKDVVGHKEIKSWGGVVKIIPLVPGLSTTKIIQKLR